MRSGYGEWVTTYEQTVEDAMDIHLLERAARGRRGRASSAPPTSAAARAAPERGCASAASPRSTASTSPPRCSTWPARARSTRSLVEADVVGHGPRVGRLRPRRHLPGRRAPRRPAPALRRGPAPRPPRRRLRARRLSPALHHGLGHADALRQRVRRGGGDPDLRAPALRPRERRAGGRLDARRDARARDRRRLARAQAEVGFAARPADRLRGRLARRPTPDRVAQPFG